MKKSLIFFIALFFSIFWLYLAQASNQHDVLINEIAWMGSTNSANDEWIELFNPTDNNIDLSGWALKSADEKININLQGQIAAGGFYLLERTDDASVPNIKTDLIYKGALNNDGLDLKLYNNANALVDEINYSSGWPKGDNTTKQTMERVNLNGWPASNASGVVNAGWQTSRDPDGTPKAKNSPGIIGEAKNANIQGALSKTQKNNGKISNSLPAAVLNSAEDEFAKPYQKSNELSPLFIFFISLAIILVSGTIILFLKFKKK